ncbi:MAG: PKD domain-containing protein, partial [Sphingobacteriales bacterium]
SLQSNGYQGASGGNYVFINFNNVGNPTNQFQIENINTTGLNNLMLSFGLRKAAVASNGSQLLVEYSTDGINYTALSFGLLDTGPGTAGWYLVDSIMGLPATQNLRLRWKNTVNNMQFQIDDISLKNPWTAPAITPTGPLTISPGGSLSLTSSAAAQYSWSNGDTTQIITITQPGCYTVTVWDMNNCIKTSQQVCVTQTTNPNPVATNSGPVCAGGTVTLTSTGGSPTSYTWSDPGGVVFSNLPSPVITPTASGMYTLTAQTATGPVTDTTFVTVYPAAPTPVAGSNSPLCEGATLTLTANTGTATALYSWSGPGITSANTNQQNPVIPAVTSAQAGTYSVFAYTTNNCVSPIATTTVVVNPVPDAPVLTSNSPVCAGQPLTLSAQTNAPGAAYSWTFPDGVTTGTGQSLNLTAAAVHNGSFTAFATAAGCSSADTSISVTVNPRDDATFSYPGSTFCQTGANPVPATAAGMSGTFTSSSGLVLNPATGEIDLAASALGSYPVTFIT